MVQQVNLLSAERTDLYAGRRRPDGHTSGIGPCCYTLRVTGLTLNPDKNTADGNPVQVRISHNSRLRPVS